MIEVDCYWQNSLQPASCYLDHGGEMNPLWPTLCPDQLYPRPLQWVTGFRKYSLVTNGGTEFRAITHTLSVLSGCSKNHRGHPLIIWVWGSWNMLKSLRVITTSKLLNNQEQIRDICSNNENAWALMRPPACALLSVFLPKSHQRTSKRTYLKRFSSDSANRHTGRTGFIPSTANMGGNEMGH